MHLLAVVQDSLFHEPCLVGHLKDNGIEILELKTY